MMVKGRIQYLRRPGDHNVFGIRILCSVDIRRDTLNLNEHLIEAAITPRTKAIIPMHYAGVGCEMDAIMDIASRYQLYVIEDAAQGIMADYKGRALGSIGHLGTYSFHDTKNIIAGEGGALLVNEPGLASRAEIIREKGTDRSRFLRSEVDKYTWQDGQKLMFILFCVTVWIYICSQQDT